MGKVNTDLVGFVQSNRESHGDVGHGCDAVETEKGSALGVMRDMGLQPINTWWRNRVGGAYGVSRR